MNGYDEASSSFSVLANFLGSTVRTNYTSVFFNNLISFDIYMSTDTANVAKVLQKGNNLSIQMSTFASAFEGDCNASGIMQIKVVPISL